MPNEEHKPMESQSPLPLPLPHDMVVEILSRLPVKSLLRFRSVCKLWSSLITDPQFASLHLNRSSDRPGAIVGFETPQGTPSFHSIDHQASIHHIDNLPSKQNPNWNHFMIIGSCNGLLLILCLSDFFIWNPSIRYFEKIENPFSIGVCRTVLFGLGYDAFIDDYKIVVAFHEGSGKRRIYAGIFSFRANTWRLIETVPFCASSSGLGIVVSGVPHWKIWSYIDNRETILCFDLVADKLKEVTIPDWFSKDFSWQLMNFSGLLCTVVCVRSCHEVWGMREYGVKESWSKMFTIPNPVLGELKPSIYDYWAPWHFMKSGKILTKMDLGQQLVIYDPKERTYEVSFCSTILQLAPYVESLVSPMRFDNMKRKEK